MRALTRVGSAAFRARLRARLGPATIESKAGAGAADGAPAVEANACTGAKVAGLSVTTA
jgi:hypothetical protein